MTVFQTIAILLSFAALGSYINIRFLRLPTSVGMMLFAFLTSLAAMGLERVGLINIDSASDFVEHIDFSGILLHGMLSFLLFAGALHVDLHELRKYRNVVAFLATIGVVISCFVTGSLIWLAARAFGFPLPYLYALLFGALISPTDPVAVLGMLKNSSVSKSLRLKISAESLLNDGVGVVAFLALLSLLQHPPLHMAVGQITFLLLWEGVGSLLLGLTLGWLAYALLHGIDDYKSEVLITLALAAGGYCFAEAVNVSAPITMVVAGLVIGTHGRQFVMSEKTRRHLDMFWDLLDDILNAVLFVLMGLEIMVIPITGPLFAISLIAIIATLVGRYVSVLIPVGLLSTHLRFEKGAVAIMTWGGLRGGISIAMALSLPPSDYKYLILGMTYLTVVFSVLFQGTTFNAMIKRVTKKG
ncbi:MAG: sodium:proton antiporter [Alphaproteobacteria bacterium]|nr:sodium:proton antiporter [Alphaproteobacteria bacterium]